MPINLHIKLATPIYLDVYSSRVDLLGLKKKFALTVADKETITPVYIACPAEDK